ncbi:hypothetical protein PRABACTJOHN_04381 [Parabacteroides johnsonii DSM 18315]|jgi:hypothetical protein|uniref:DUF349 domain-containing protein n=1 Tax=Parabacteroides johnsonii DSM 18315 TaxID=537006 RepID=B7BH32_9BACT|nr:DUF349 domain-containing protein [Parabacteroides johnsonii]EEC94272.1 hypothetical protein PRABACTJOHN_04381 [Parabacteroides johnsonii DSM 18315]UEA90428.1 DUF349 domain-containing protein [Parabacteroides johnsonii]UWP42596.1 DUF349 domain-containing protein [Parabacteroides johnsonii DSM 18315]HJG98220.1 DUF349 domain-containing protein [Parabacteroides johnsonii]
MKDTHEANLPTEENGKLEETKAPETTPENTAEAVVTNETPDAGVAAEETSEAEVKTDEVAAGEETVATTGKLSKEEILEKLTGLVGAAADTTRNEVEALKQAYYKIHRSEVDELKKAFLTAGGEEKDFVAPEDETESKIKELLNVYKEKRAAILAEEERVKAANYALKLQLIDQLKALTESQEDFNKLYNDFKDIQQRWKEVKAVPQEHVSELWKNYQIYSEKFYDIIKINNQFRDYDFKKNLEMKTALCETVEKLQTEPDVVSAFHQLQKLHQQWREIGPVAKELREDLWSRFKAASTIINKRHQEHFEGLKAKEQENLEAKTAICEQIENIDFQALKSFKDWEEKNKEVIALQDKWKTIGFAPKKSNVKIFERFRAACDVYFNRKSEFYKNIKDEMEKNLELKKALCEKAEALKDSTDWKSTTEKMIALQKEWKTIGSVARKHSDAVWKRFISACDYFFEQKNKNASSQKSVEQTNLAAKKALIEKINTLDEADHDEALAVLKGYMAEWNTIGHVPFKEKDKVYKEYHEAVDQQFDRLKVDQNDRKMQTFRSNLSDMSNGERGKGKLYGEREKLMRMYERMKNELQTYENNIGFLSISSKGGGGLLKEMERKIDKLKNEMALIIKKIDAIDENLE